MRKVTSNQLEKSSRKSIGLAFYSYWGLWLSLCEGTQDQNCKFFRNFSKVKFEIALN